MFLCVYVCVCQGGGMDEWVGVYVRVFGWGGWVHGYGCVCVCWEGWWVQVNVEYKGVELRQGVLVAFYLCQSSPFFSPFFIHSSSFACILRLQG